MITHPKEAFDFSCGEKSLPVLGIGGLQIGNALQKKPQSYARIAVGVQGSGKAWKMAKGEKLIKDKQHRNFRTLGG